MERKELIDNINDAFSTPNEIFFVKMPKEDIEEHDEREKKLMMKGNAFHT
jgi:hypothetical protein